MVIGKDECSVFLLMWCHENTDPAMRGRVGKKALSHCEKEIVALGPTFLFTYFYFDSIIHIKNIYSKYASSKTRL